MEVVANAAPNTLGMRDSDHRLYPFMLASVCGQLSLSFELLRARPDILTLIGPRIGEGGEEEESNATSDSFIVSSKLTQCANDEEKKLLISDSAVKLSLNELTMAERPTANECHGVPGKRKNDTTAKVSVSASPPPSKKCNIIHDKLRKI